MCGEFTIDPMLMAAYTVLTIEECNLVLSNIILREMKSFRLPIVCQFGAMHTEWPVGGGGWASQWKHRGGKEAIGSTAVDTRVATPCLHFVEGWGFEARLSHLLDSNCAKEVDTPELSLRLIRFDRPFWSASWVNNFRFWTGDTQCEVHCLAHCAWRF